MYLVYNTWYITLQGIPSFSAGRRRSCLLSIPYVDFVISYLADKI